jgi:N-acyl homoserine lactone hydrolase
MLVTDAMPQRLYLMQLSTTNVPLPAGRMLAMSTGCYLVQMGDGQNILIDSGLPVDYTPPANSPVSENNKNVLEHLADLHVSPDDIHFVICTHFDVDHAGYHDAFRNATFVVQREHYELARSGHKRLQGARTHWDHPALHYQLVEGDSELLPGLTVITTNGHVVGHQSVLIHLPQTGNVLLVIDAVPLQRLFTLEWQGSQVDENKEQIRDSTQKLLDVVEREHVNLVIFGHDGVQWQTLKKAPEFYV